MFSILDFGVDFKADEMEMQLVLPDHLLSIADGLAIMQKDLVRKAGHGWYDVYGVIPRNPWRPQQVGSRRAAALRRSSSANRPRCERSLTPLGLSMSSVMTWVCAFTRSTSLRALAMTS